MSTRTLLFTECVDLAGSACKPFSGTKKYVSTGAVDKEIGRLKMDIEWLKKRGGIERH